MHPFLVHNNCRTQEGKFTALRFEVNSNFPDKPWTRSEPATFVTTNVSSGVTAGSQVSAVLRALFWDKNWDKHGRRVFVGPGRFADLWAASFTSEAWRCAGDLGLPSFQAHGDFMGLLRGLEGRA